MNKLAPRRVPADLRGLASRWVAVRRRVDRLGKEMKTLSGLIIQNMKHAGVLNVQIGRSSVQLVIDKGKSHISKKSLIEHFGERMAEEFWKKVPDKISERLSLAEPKGKR